MRGHRTTSCGSRPSSASLSRIASAVNGLITYSWAPAARARTIWRVLALGGDHHDVTLRQAGLARTAETNCSPSITGMFQSTQTRSGTQPVVEHVEALAAVAGRLDLVAEALEDPGDDAPHRA